MSSQLLSRRDLMRVGGAAAALGIAGPALTGCSRAPESSTASEDDNGTFTLYTSTGHVYDTWAKIFDEFEQDHGVSVNWQKFSWADMQTKLQTNFAGGNVPDLVERPGGYDVVSMAVNGDILALDDYIAADGEEMGYPDDWEEQAVSSWQLDGSTYGVQLQLTCYQIYYNKQMLADAGIEQPPDNWDDFLSAAQELTRGDVFGHVINWNHLGSWPWLMANDVVQYDADSEGFLVPHEAAIDAMQFQADLVHKHKVAPVPVTGPYPWEFLVENRAAMILSGPWDLVRIADANPDLELGISLPLQGKVRRTALAGSGVMIPAESPHPDLAWDLIKRMTTLDAQISLTEDSNQTMPRKSWAEADEIKANDLISAVAEALPYAQAWNASLAPTGKVNEVGQAYKTFFEDIVTGGKPVKGALDVYLDAAGRALG